VQTPFTRCIPAPQASRTSMRVSSDGSGASGMACDDDTSAAAKAAAINLVVFPSLQSRRPSKGGTGFHAYSLAAIRQR
jgi:hypothetical protein